jgi:PiT family inorganic phosphate transporter
VLAAAAAVAWAAFFNFIAFLLFHGAVAASIAKGVDASAITLNVILATLLGAIAWNLVTWYLGLPSSSSHALMGAFAGAGVTHSRSLSVLSPTVYGKTLLFIVVSPLLGALLGVLIMRLVRVLARDWTPSRVESTFRRLQLVSAGPYSIGHGGNDAQKTMGIIMALLLIGHPHPPKVEPHIYVVLACHIAMGLGTLSGGWRIVKTMGMKITKLRPVGGFSAETAGAATLFLATIAGIPVSTTHTITGSIVGVGSATGKLSAVRWGVAGRIVWAWVLTIPAAALMSSLTYLLVSQVSGQR